MCWTGEFFLNDLIVEIYFVQHLNCDNTAFEFFLIYQRHKVGIFANHFIPFIAFTVVTHRFGLKMTINLLIRYSVLKELIR